MGHQPVPDEQHEQRADGRADETRYQPMVWPMKVATNAPAIPSPVVSMKPFKLFGPGERKRAMMPAMKPITMIQIMFDTTISLGWPLGRRW